MTLSSIALPGGLAGPARRAGRVSAVTWPLAVFVLALLPRLIDLGSRSFWLDEIFTADRASLKPAGLVYDSFVNHHMPTFFLMLSPFVSLGDPQFWLRFPSAVFGALSVMLVYLLGSRVAGRMAGLFAALILGLSPIALAFAQEARSYTLEMTLILAALLGVVTLAMDIPAASQPLYRKSALRGAWAAYLLASAAALDVLGDALPWVLTANLIFGVLVWKSPRRLPLLGNILLVDLAMAALSLPLYVIMAHTVKNGFVHSFDWIPPLTGPRIWYSIASVYLMRVADWVTFNLMAVPTPASLMWLIDAGLIGAVLLALWRLRSRPGLLAALALSFLVLPVATIVISIWQPILLPRYILWSSAPFAVLAGIGASMAIARLPHPVRTLAFTGIAALLLINLLPYYSAPTKPRWDVAARMLAGEVEPGDVIYVSDGGALPILRYYLPADVKAVVLKDSEGDLRHAEAAQLQGRRVWAVYGHAGQSATRHGLLRFERHIAPLGTPVQVQMAGNRIYISEFDATSHGVSEDCTAPAPSPQPGAAQASLTPVAAPCG